MTFLKRPKLIIIFLLLCIICITLFVYTFLNQTYYTAEDFHIPTIKSKIDANNNGIDDYTDILLGARIDAENHPTYNGKYWDNGYPPSDIGVCTDVIWRAFKYAGYNLRRMVDQDIAISNEQDYHIKTPDSNIDFRRVGNLYVFFHKYAESLTLDISKIEEWQPGDIVVFGSMKHIGIISDKRNKNSEPFLIHNSGQPFREENVLRKLAKKDGITGHFRWDASKIEDIIILWEEK